jgi:CelD/BcsL family acetyltransferase involved in cellulose biosynthesis
LCPFVGPNEIPTEIVSSPKARIEVSRDAATIAKIADQYNSLLEHADWVNPYFSPEWLRVWWGRQKQERAPLFLLAYDEAGSMLGYWPLVERPGLLGSKGLWPFVYDEANYHFPTCASTVAPLLVEELSRLIGRFLFVWLPQLPKPFWDSCLKDKVESTRHLNILRCSCSASTIEPHNDQSFANFWEEKMGAKTRKSFRYDQRALSVKGEVNLETFTTFEDVRSAMPATCLVEVASHKTQENAGLYTIRGKRAFFFELLPDLAQAGRVRASFLRVNDHPVAWQLELLSPGYSCLHHLAYDEAWKKYSPGKQLLRHCLERCWGEGRVFDFLPAPFSYKEGYATHSVPAHELHWIHKSIRGRIARRLIRWNMEWRKKMRNRSPGLAATAARQQVSAHHSQESV